MMSSPSTPGTAVPALAPALAPDLAPATPERENTLLSSMTAGSGAADRREHQPPLTLEEASAPSTSSSSSLSPLVTLVSADGHRLTLPRRVAEESGTVRQLLLSRDDDDASDITIPLPAVRKRELVSIFGFCARQLEGRDELERIRQREEAREGGQGRRARASGGRGSRGGGGGGAEAASASPAPGAGPSHAALSLALRAALAADAAAWASSRSSSSSSSSSSAGGIGVGGSGGGGGHSSRALLGRALAANFLDIPVALAACADAVAAGIRGRSPAEIRARFGIAPDLSVAEEEAIKADCAWAFDCC